MDAVLQKFPPGLSVPPHRYIVLSMASIAEHNGNLNVLHDCFCSFTLIWIRILSLKVFKGKKKVIYLVNQ